MFLIEIRWDVSVFAKYGRTIVCLINNLRIFYLVIMFESRGLKLWLPLEENATIVSRKTIYVEHNTLGYGFLALDMFLLLFMFG